MSIDFARSLGGGRGRIAGVVAAATATVALSLASAAPASAIGPSATLAPIGTGSYLLTITAGAEQVTSLALIGENITNVAPAGICEPQTDSPICGFATVPPMTSKQFCYSGPAVTEVGFNLIEQVKVSSAPAVASCPVPGFKPPKTSPMKCKKGFVKKTVHGKAKCVMHKHKKHKH
jgi:hypothetical protein